MTNESRNDVGTIATNKNRPSPRDDDYPPITPEILRSLTHEQARSLVHHDDTPTALRSILQQRVDDGVISRSQFWNAVPLSSIPWRLLQGEPFARARMEKLGGNVVADKSTSRTVVDESTVDESETKPGKLKRDTVRLVLPPPPQLPYYTPWQTVELLSTFRTCKAAMEELVRRNYVPVTVGQLYGLMRRVKNGEEVGDWRVREKAKERTSVVGAGNTQSLKRRRNEEEGHASSRKQPTRTKKRKVPPFVECVRSLEDEEFVRQVALEFRRRGYVLGLTLGVWKEEEAAAATTTNGAEKTKKKRRAKENEESMDHARNGTAWGEGACGATHDAKDSGPESSAVEKNPPTESHSNPTLPSPLPTNLLFYPSTTPHPPHLARKWNDMYAQLKLFHREHGHIHVPLTNKSLHAWVTRQMSQWKDMQKMGVRHSMSMDRIRKLHVLGFGEEETAQTSSACEAVAVPTVEAEKKRMAKSGDRLWDQRFQELKAFQESRGTTVVPRHVNDLLSKWTYKQRIYCKRIRQGDTTTPLTRERLEKLEEIGFDTSGDFKAVRVDQRKRNKIKADKAWEEKFHELVAFKEIFGHCDVKEKKEKDYPYNRLAGWVGLQRIKYKKRMKGMIHGRTFEITDEQIKRLASIGFNFAGKILDFEVRFKQLQEFIKEFGHTRVPVFYAEHDNLGRWAKRMRDGIRMNEPWVNEIHKARLLGIGFDIAARQVFDHPWKKREDEDSGELDFGSQEE